MKKLNVLVSLSLAYNFLITDQLSFSQFYENLLSYEQDFAWNWYFASGRNKLSKEELGWGIFFIADSRSVWFLHIHPLHCTRLGQKCRSVYINSNFVVKQFYTALQSYHKHQLDKCSLFQRRTSWHLYENFTPEVLQ